VNDAIGFNITSDDTVTIAEGAGVAIADGVELTVDGALILVEESSALTVGDGGTLVLDINAELSGAGQIVIASGGAFTANTTYGFWDGGTTVTIQAQYGALVTLNEDDLFVGVDSDAIINLAEGASVTFEEELITLNGEVTVENTLDNFNLSLGASSSVLTIADGTSIGLYSSYTLTAVDGAKIIMGSGGASITGNDAPLDDGGYALTEGTYVYDEGEDYWVKEVI
jgi:hypothetical protein